MRNIQTKVFFIPKIHIYFTNVAECLLVNREESTHQAVYESHAQSVGSLVQFHYKHHTQVVRKRRSARGRRHGEREVTATNTACRRTHTQHTAQKHTQAVATVGKHRELLQTHAQMVQSVVLRRACRCRTHYTTYRRGAAQGQYRLHLLNLSWQ